AWGRDDKSSSRRPISAPATARPKTPARAALAMKYLPSASLTKTGPSTASIRAGSIDLTAVRSGSSAPPEASSDFLSPDLFTRAASSTAENALGLGHCHELAEGRPLREVVYAAGTCDNVLLGRHPTVGQNALRNDLAGFHFRILHIHSPDADLPVAHETFV